MDRRAPSQICTSLLLSSVVFLSSCNGCTSSQSGPAVGGGPDVVATPSAEFTEFLPGGAVPALEGECSDGTTASLAGLRGKTVLLNFWATWCIPCVAEMPALERIYQKYRERGFTILAVSVDQEPGLVDEFVRQNGITFPVMRDLNFERANRFGISGFPETFFVSADGKFLSVVDPETGNEGVRIISDRAWDSKDYLALIESLLPVAPQNR